MTDRDFELTRRKVLGAAGALGLAGAGAGLGTTALFTDTETVASNSLTAGSLDLFVDAWVPAGGISSEWEGAIGFEEYDPETANGEPGVGIQLGDLKPGDWVLVCYELTVMTNPACLRLGVAETATPEHGLTEPESAAGDDSSGDTGGELAQHLAVSVYDDLDESVTLDGSRSTVAAALGDELLGDVSLAEFWSLFADGATVATDTATFDFCVLLELPRDVGNVVQSDGVAWDFVFDAVQSRHNTCGTPVWVADAVSVSASPDTAGATDSVHRVEVPVGSALDGETLASLTVDYPSDFDVGGVGPGDILGAGVQRTDSSIAPLTVTAASASDGDTAVAFSFDGTVSVAAGETIFVEYRDVTNASTADDYAVVVDVNGAEIGPGTLTLTPAGGPTQPVISTFEDGDDGWEITGDAQGGSAVPDFEASIGNPAPSISATDDVQGGVWYFKAPGKFLADKSGFYGGTLAYDLREDSDKSNQFSARDIILEGGGMTLAYDHGGTSSHPPNDGSFGSYSVDLDETDSWTRNGNPATQAEMQTVLGDLTGLRIRGEYESGPDKGYLDNAQLSPP